MKHPTAGRLASLLLSAAAALLSLQPFPLRVSAFTSTCGENATWTVEGDSLTIAGTGVVSQVSWSAYADEITTVVIQNGITTLPEHCFDGFSVLRSVEMADSVTAIGRSFCNNCPKLETVKFSDQLAEIPSNAFYCCISLHDLTLPAALKAVGESAFYSDVKLDALELPAGVTKVGSSAFYGNNITTLTLNDGLQTIGARAFGMSCFRAVRIPESVTSIGEDAIGKYYDTVTMRGSKLAGSYTVSPGITTIYGKTGSAAETYANAAGLNFVDSDEEPEAHTHTWSAWAVTIAATCEAQGTRARTCSGCGKVESEPIAATGHTWSAWATVKEPSCGVDGEQQRSCAACGKIETEAIAGTEHDFGGWVTVVEPGCESEGQEKSTCKNCGVSETRMLALLGHNWGEWKVKTAPGCEAFGTNERTCFRCGTSETMSVAPTGHSWTNWETVKEASLTEDGLRAQTCVNCGIQHTEVIPKLAGYTVSVTAGTGGSVSPSGVVTAAAGESVTLRVTADSGYQLASVQADGAAVQLNWDGTYTFTNLSANHTFTAVFTPVVQQPTRSCSAVSITPKRQSWFSDESAFQMNDFTVSACIIENGATNWQDITSSCSPAQTPAEAANGSYGNTSVTFRYQGGDSAISAYLAQNPLRAEAAVWLRGDSNGNARVEVDDALLALRAYVEYMTNGRLDSYNEQQAFVMDVDGDKSVSLEDAMYILQYYTMDMTDLNPKWSQIIAK